MSNNYAGKFVSAETAVKAVQPGDWVDYGFGAGFPELLDRALAARRDELTDVKIRGGLVIRPRIEVVESDPEQKAFSYYSWHIGDYERKLQTRGLCKFMPMMLRSLPEMYATTFEWMLPLYRFPDQMRTAAADWVFPNYAWRTIFENARTVIFEINERLPRLQGVDGSHRVHLSEADFIVEGEHEPLPIRTYRDPSAIDIEIAKRVVEEIPDGACLQLGIGGMPNAVGALIAKSDLKDLGVHTEMYVDAFVDIANAGKITGARKNIDKGRQVYAFGAGTKKLYDYLNKNPECMSAPVDYTNDVRTISALDNFMSINNAVDLDLFGQVNAESAGIKHISGAGGQLDFVLGAYLSRGGKSFICCSSTFKKKDGTLESRIVPTLAPGSIVTDTRANIHYLVTEYGKVNLKGLSTWQKTEAIISVAHPQFRDQLIAEAEKMHIWRASNKR